MAGLLDFLQAASNAVAGNVSGPVDLLSMGLRYAGLPIPQDAVGSSQWMKQKGLLRDVPQSASSLAGETLGLLSPLAAARAPQIARGLLAAQEAAPQMMSRGAMVPANQEGAIRVFHGSPHTFDKMSSSAIGTGEGAQAYGHGLYFAENPNVASGYADRLSSVPIDDGEKMVSRYLQYGNSRPRVVDMNAPSNTLTPAETALSYIHMNRGSAFDAMQDIAGMIESKPPDVNRYEKALKVLESGKLKRGLLSEKSGNLYEADLRWPNPSREAADPLGPQHFLDWDKPLSQQSEEVKLRIQDIIAKERAYLERYPNSPMKDPFGVNIYASATTTGKSQDAARELAKRGIPGITYLDAGSRAAGDGTRNYVTFSDELIDLLKRNGAPLK